MLVSPLALSDITRDFRKTDYFPAFVSHDIQDGKLIDGLVSAVRVTSAGISPA